MTKRAASKPRTLTLETTVLRKLTDEQLQLAVGGVQSEMTCAEQGCERRRA